MSSNEKILTPTKSGKKRFCGTKISKKFLVQGAEALIIEEGNKIIKQRIKKSYRISELDEKIRKLRTRSEAKLLEKASKIINIPKVLKVDEKSKEIIMDFIQGKRLSEHLDSFPLNKQKEILNCIGKETSKLHKENIIHGDLTTSNMILVENDNKKSKMSNLANKPLKESSSLTILNKSASDSEPIIFFIDFGLGFQNGKIEDKAVDIHLLKQALEAKHFTHWQTLFNEFEKGYTKINNVESNKVLERLKAVEKRGRYKH